MGSNALEYAEAFRALRANWRRRLLDDVGSLESAASALSSPGDHAQTLTQMAAVAHRLAGSGAAFDAPEVSSYAREIEAILRATLAGDATIAHPAHAAFSNTVARLATAAAAAGEEIPIERSDPTPNITAGPDRRSLFVVDDDPIVCGEIALQLCHFGYRVRTFSDLGGFRDAIADDPPTLVVMDLVFPAGSATGTEVLQTALAQGTTAPPVLFVSSRTDFDARLQAVRAGAVAYFSKPLNVSALVDCIESLTNPDLVTPLRVLIVDDDVELAEAYGIALRAVGVNAAVVTDPRAVLSGLADLRPDVVLLDLYLGGCSGAEVARVIRSDSSNVSIPILFLSAESDRDKQIEVMRSGADDFLAKPIAPEQLAREFLARAPRIRALQGHLSSDGLTGLLNHVASRAGLERELARARRDRAALSVVMLDLDGFKSVNDRHGHPVGDRVLRSLAWLLRKRLRTSDLVGRYGGEEFVVILPGTATADAVGVIEGLREAFSGLRHASPRGEFRVTFSAGVASFPEAQSAGRLLDGADRALYDAKAAGRNCVVVASPYR